MSQTDRPVGWQTFARAWAARAAPCRVEEFSRGLKRRGARGPPWISFRSFRADLLSMVKDATPNGILRFACQCVEDEAKFKKRGGWLNC